MSKIVLRYINDQQIELYKLRKGNLIYSEVVSIHEAKKFKCRSVIISPHHYVKGHISSSELAFQPDDNQFIFSDLSVMKPDEISYLPTYFDKVNDVYIQFWLSMSSLRELTIKFPFADRFYPEYSACGTEDTLNNLNGKKFLRHNVFFQKKSHRRTNNYFLFFTCACLISAGTPWFDEFESAFLKPKVTYENKLYLSEKVSVLFSEITLPRLDSIEMNYSLARVKLSFSQPIASSVRISLDKYCQKQACEFREKSKAVILEFYEHKSDS